MNSPLVQPTALGSANAAGVKRYAPHAPRPALLSRCVHRVSTSRARAAAAAAVYHYAWPPRLWLWLHVATAMVAVSFPYRHERHAHIRRSHHHFLGNFLLNGTSGKDSHIGLGRSAEHITPYEGHSTAHAVGAKHEATPKTSASEAAAQSQGAGHHLQLRQSLGSQAVPGKRVPRRALHGLRGRVDDTAPISTAASAGASSDAIPVASTLAATFSAAAGALPGGNRFRQSADCSRTKQRRDTRPAADVPPLPEGPHGVGRARLHVRRGAQASVASLLQVGRARAGEQQR
ncbi:hypothetical protein MTO96_013555 [Rhipicephalus appendiculatus]